jgi:hypothetical protein
MSPDQGDDPAESYQLGQQDAGSQAANPERNDGERLSNSGSRAPRARRARRRRRGVRVAVVGTGAP